MATLQDVAQLAGVSTATVSHVINGSKAVRPETRARVEVAIAQLDFVLDPAGRQLAQKRQRTRISSPSRVFRKANPDDGDVPQVKPRLLPQAEAGQPDLALTSSGGDSARTMLRIIRDTQPISRADLARCLEVSRGTVTEIVNPLIASGVLREEVPDQRGGRGRPPIGLSLRADRALFVGVNIGVRHTQVGAATADGVLLAEESFETTLDSRSTLSRINSIIDRLDASLPERTLLSIGVSVPGPTDARRKELLFAPHLGWRQVPIAEVLSRGAGQWRKAGNLVPVIVDNDATAAAMYERRRLSRDRAQSGRDDFVLVRAGTGIGVGLVIGGEVYRGTGTGRGLLGEFGHMTVVVDGKLCACGNRGCWELYASATSAAALYSGERALRKGERRLPLVEIVARAEAGERRAQATLARVGKYLGIGIGNLITGLGVTRVIVSGRLVHGWKFVEKPVREALSGTMAGRLTTWFLEAGQPTGAGLGGALEVAVEHYLTKLVTTTRAAA